MKLSGNLWISIYIPMDVHGYPRISFGIHPWDRRLGGFLRPGNLNGSCVRDPVAGFFIVISAPVTPVGACPLGLVLDFVLRNQIKSCSER